MTITKKEDENMKWMIYGINNKGETSGLYGDNENNKTVKYYSCWKLSAEILYQLALDSQFLHHDLIDHYMPCTISEMNMGALLSSLSAYSKIYKIIMVPSFIEFKVNFLETHVEILQPNSLLDKLINTSRETIHFYRGILFRVNNELIDATFNEHNNHQEHIVHDNDSNRQKNKNKNKKTRNKINTVKRMMTLQTKQRSRLTVMFQLKSVYI